MVTIDFGLHGHEALPVAGFTPVQWAGLGIFVLGCVLCIGGRSMMLGDGIGAQDFGL